MRAQLPAQLIGCLLFVSACSNSSSTTSVDMAQLPDLAPMFPAPHSALPQAKSMGGPVMASPKIVAISFPNDSLVSSIDDFVSKLAASKYWGGAVAEYGVGAATALPPVHSTDMPAKTLTDTAIQSWLANQIAKTPGFPQPDGSTLYALFYQSDITINAGGASCNAFQGYHSDFKLGGKFVTYIVLARCPPPVAGVTILDNLTATASHEFIEAATDPLAQDNPAWNTVDDAHLGWTLLGGGELGDLCAPFPDSFYKPTDLPYLVQRTWSNAAAQAGHDPCQPDGNSPYFNSAPVTADMLDVSIPGAGELQTQGIHIPVGQSVTVELDLYSDAPTSGPWTLSTLDLGAAFMGQPTELSFSLDSTTGQNGDKRMLTIKAERAAANGASIFWIQNDLGDKTSVWLGLVGN